ncbi:MAG: hypothetical protein LBQ93_06255 [Treponema sp.]|jgi:hypothetical protein|nr:hypothetical protein [Treponema sp.]
MKKQNFWVYGMLVMALVFGMTVVGCKDAEDESKTLVITGVSASDLSSFEDKMIGLFPAGTTGLNFTVTNVVAGNFLEEGSDITVSGTTVTIPLYDLDEKRWTGSGSYIIAIGTGAGTADLKTNAVDFSEKTTTVARSAFN